MGSGDSGILLVQLFIAVLFGFWCRSIFAKKGRSPGWGFVIGFCLSLIGVVICSLVKPSEEYQAELASIPKTDEKKCPHCLEIIKVGATVCKHCGNNPNEAVLRSR